MASIPSSPSGETGYRLAVTQTSHPPRWESSPPPTSKAGRPPAGLASMVESEIIPRLMLAHQRRPLAQDFAFDDTGHLGRTTTETFARMVIARDADSLIAFVGHLLRQGTSLEAIYTDLLVPAARRLGDYWNEDSASFTDVTVGLGRLQQVVRALGASLPDEGGPLSRSHSAFFAPAPGEQHIFGLFIVEDVFRRAGWRTWIETAMAEQELAETVRNHWFDVFGISASGTARQEQLAASIQAVRKASRNPNLFVLAGGVLFIEHPELADGVGADATASSGAEALLLASHALLIAGNEISAHPSGA